MEKVLYEKIMKGDKKDAISAIAEVNEDNIEEIENLTNSEFMSLVITSLSVLAYDEDFRKVVMGFLKTIAIEIRTEYINE